MADTDYRNPVNIFMVYRYRELTQPRYKKQGKGVGALVFKKTDSSKVSHTVNWKQSSVWFLLWS